MEFQGCILTRARSTPGWNNQRLELAKSPLPSKPAKKGGKKGSCVRLGNLDLDPSIFCSFCSPPKGCLLCRISAPRLHPKYLNFQVCAQPRWKWPARPVYPLYSKSLYNWYTHLRLRCCGRLGDLDVDPSIVFAHFVAHPKVAYCAESRRRGSTLSTSISGLRSARCCYHLRRRCFHQLYSAGATT